MTVLQNLSLEMGAILRSWWPEDPKRIEPGTKFRPVVFLAEKEIAGVRHFVVAYGTSKTEQHKEARNGGDLLVLVLDEGQVVLNADTRFDFNQIRVIPATEQFFCSSHDGLPVKTSAIPHRYYQSVLQAMQCADVPRQFVRLGITV